MTAQILDGKATAAEIREEIARAVKGGVGGEPALTRTDVSPLGRRPLTQTALNRQPGLATLLVGDDPGSAVYVRNKHRACAEVGFHSADRRLPATASQDEVLAEIASLNADPEIDAFIVQLPLPEGLDEREALEAIDPAKDGDGLHPVSLGRLVLGQPSFLPGTPKGILTLGERFGIQWAGSHVVVVGRGTTVGRPLGLLLGLKGVDATVTTCHSRTPDLASYTREADVIVVAVGRAGILTADMVKPGATVFDVGISRGPDGIAGDVAPEVRDVAGWLAPVPGGVGPMTIAMLLSNTLEAAQARSGLT